jgi:WD40-like Beta Propeller Repeat
MRRIAVPLVLLLAASSWGPGCSCSNNGQGTGDDGGGGPDLAMNPDAIAGGDLVVTPPDVTLDITIGGAAPSQVYTATTMGGMDVSSSATWTVDDTSLGSFAGRTFTANTTHGGTTLVHATWQGLTGYATLHVKLHASISTDTCPGCPPFPPDTTPACTGAAMSPAIIYPPNGALVPPNMNVLETQFDQGMGNTLFEIDYQNAATDVRVETRCNVITDSKGNVTNGCAYDLSQQVWDFLATSNRGGDPLNIIVRATDAAGSCIATSSSMVAISFGEEDLNGGIYYWQSVTVTGLQGATGGIFRYDFGKRGQTPSAFLAPTASGGTQQRCVGCHFLSRDGVKMTYGNDDADADDEYSDLKTNLLDVATKAVVQFNKPGFQAFLPDHTRLLASNGVGVATTFFQFDGTTAAALTPATISSGAVRGTHPDWSADGSKIVFAGAPASAFAFPAYNRVDDNHFTSGSLYTMTYAAGTYGAPQPLLTSAGENNYYPAFSPDGAFVAFNRAPASGAGQTCTSNSCPNDAFSNPSAHVMIMPASGGTPVDLTALNGGGATLTNSWPRFAPNVQMYKGHQIAWVTFSSTRNYGDVVRNTTMVAGAPQHICYPPESPENTSTNKNVTSAPECMQPQLWMAAIDLTAASGTADPSFPAFWLPFQDSASHNHIAQWVVSIVGPPPPPDGGADGPTCIPGNGACTAGDTCCNGVCCTGMCGCIP